jgi:GPH family glycoside/pentoside/hexuronide:cation symporter
MEISAPSARDGSLPVTEKFAYGAGSLCDFFMANILGALAVPIFTLGFGMDPFLLSIALAIPQVFAFAADIFVGPASDNSKSRLGRRKPFIAFGAGLGALLMPLVWWCPRAGDVVMFAWVTVFGAALAICRSFFAVPYGALGMELTPNYDERTRVIAWKNFVGIIGTFCAAWFYWFTQRPVWGNEIVGTRVLSVLGAVLVAAACVFLILKCGERRRVSTQQPRIRLREAIGTTFKNRPFTMVLGAQMLLAFGTGVVGVLGSYVHIMFACAGDKDLASRINGLGGSLTVFSNLAAIPLGLWVSKHYGKRNAALAGLAILFCGLALLPYTLRPENPWLVVVTWTIDAIGMPCAAMIFGAMIPDVCDEDELRTGLRREGTYSAVNSFVGRIVGIVTLMASGILPKLAGYTQTATAEGVPIPPDAPMLEKMRVMLIAVQIAVVIFAIIIVRLYPITRERAAETQRKIAAQRQAAASPIPSST